MCVHKTSVNGRKGTDKLWRYTKKSHTANSWWQFYGLNTQQTQHMNFCSVEDYSNYRSKIRLTTQKRGNGWSFTLNSRLVLCNMNTDLTLNFLRYSCKYFSLRMSFAFFSCVCIVWIHIFEFPKKAHIINYHFTW